MQDRYTFEEYEKLIKKISRNPVRAGIGLPIFFIGLTFSFLIVTFFQSNLARLILFLLMFTFPYYAFQLIIQRIMQKHLEEARRIGYKPFYQVTNLRFGAAVYIGFWLVAAGWLMILDELIKYSRNLLI